MQRTLAMVTQNVNHRSTPSPADWQVEVFYDGDCPLCRREINALRRMDRKRNIRFTNIAAADFRPDDFGIGMQDFLSEIHGRLPDGTWIRGVEVFRKLYSAVGWTPIVRLSRLPVVSGLLETAYRLFARNRLRLTGRCATAGSSCRIES
jgi:predicted DCC family thiol-disulfide oxidoreductase YuxK